MLLLIISILVIYGVYIKLIKPGFYWQKRGIVHAKPWMAIVKVVCSSKSFFEIIIDSYNQFSDRRYYGSYQFMTPSLFVRDLDLIKRITVKDFDHFTDRMNFISEKADPLMGLNLFNLGGEKWRDMRSTLSPAFTSAKMRAMYTLMQETAEHFVEYFLLDDNEVIELEMKNIFSRYTNDVIANCAFGIKCDSLNEKNNEFYTMGLNVTTPKPSNMVRGVAAAFFPKVFEVLKIKVFSTTVWDFFRKIVSETISYREKENIIRPDMIHLLMEAKKGRLRHEDEKTSENDTGFATVEESALGKSVGKMELTHDLITAQALVFFLAGFDTASTLLSFLTYELALNPDIQTKLQAEVDEAAKAGVSYEEILKMKYLDQVVSEALRKYPGGFILVRQCVKDYKIEAERDYEKDIVVEKDCLVTIPISGIHRDPNYFPDPERFDPDRFSDENKEKIVSGSYMPFGSGPRNCIGSRFALLEAKVLIVSLMSRFDIVPVKRTTVPITLAKSVNLTVKDGFWLGFKNRNR
ncbi:cytochrome P450 9e2 isoform X2 [Anoplophora glabripennis]|uniref:cytochrome P450 9e2 isoform X2 n=1 Tax=Anoplophora glabripennis TaxID=217634 RepID=UPI000874C913|nr:cytochrome P450 9e2 isoform X2 [Anoplophora glabripennis]